MAPRRHGSKLTFEQVNEVRRAVSAGRTQQSVAGEYGVDPSTVNKIVRGHTRTREIVLPSVEAIRVGNKARHKSWRDANADHVRMKGMLSHHSFRVSGAGRVSKAEWLSILEFFDHRCAYCGVRDKMTLDHVIPVSVGGLHDPTNVVPSCGSCNFVKGRSGPLVMVNRNYELRSA